MTERIVHPTQDCPEMCNGFIDATGMHYQDPTCPHNGKRLTDEEWAAAANRPTGAVDLMAALKASVDRARAARRVR